MIRAMLATLMMLAALGAATTPAAAKQKILKVDEAFRYEVSAAGDEVLVEWTIEPGHYLYKERMSYASRTPAIRIGAPIMPAGKLYSDEFFGDMHIFRDHATVRVPIIDRGVAGPGADLLELELRSQGCADIGLCYPPQVWTARVRLASLDDGFSRHEPGRNEPGSGGKLSRLMSGGQTRVIGANDPLPPEQAFTARVDVVDPFNLRIDWTIAAGYYLYRDSLTISTSGTDAQAGEPTLPPGVTEQDEYFGQTRVFYSAVAMHVPLTRATPAATMLPLVIEYQGCKKDSICYPPQRLELEVALPAASASDPLRDIGPPPEEMVSEQDRLSNLILNANLLLVMVTFAGLGLLLAFTPCVLPMVPILSGIIARQGKDVTTGKAFALSLTYVLGMALTYTAAGAAFAAAGGQIQAALQKPWIIVGVAGLFVALALSMFGYYEIQVPAALQTRLSAASNRQRAGTFIGTAIMGMLSALIVTTCVAPPLVASMTVIAEAGDITRGAAALFAMSMGMGLPLLVIGTSAGRLLPKAGAWMDQVKGAFGFMMLGLAIWMLERILPGAVTMAMWGVLVFMAGIFLGAFQALDIAAPSAQKFSKGAGLLASLYGAVLLVGALSGQTNPLQPLRFGTAGPQTRELEFRLIKSVDDLDRELATAAAQGQPVMLDFYADWCVSCKEMEHYTFTDAAVQDKLSKTRVLQADVTANDDLDQALLRRFGIFGPPTIVFFDSNGVERRNFRIVGFMPADKFAAHVQSAQRHQQLSDRTR